MRFGEWLYEKRVEMRLTQGELAKRAGISTSYVSTLEREQPHGITNATPQPTADVVDALAKVLGANIDTARMLAGYAPANGSSTSIPIKEDIQLILNRRDISPEDQEEYDRAVKLAVAMAEQRIEEKRNIPGAQKQRLIEATMEEKPVAKRKANK